MSDRAKPLLFAGIIILVLGLSPLTDPIQEPFSPDLENVGAPSPETTIENLRAFAKLYGYVRYFHPSDAAANTDWDKFAVHGVQHVKDAANRTELRATLDSLFGPIAPTVQLYRTGTEPPDPPEMLTPVDTTGLNLVSWQHRGLGLGNRGPYRSVRLHRQAQTSGGSDFGTVIQDVSATPHREKQVRLRAAVRAEVSDGDGRAQLWLRVDRTGDQFGFFDNMGDRPITTPNWKTYQITGTVAEDAERIVFGGFLAGRGTAQFDSFQLQVRDSTDGEWTTLPLENAGFETGAAGESPAGWGVSSDAYEMRTKEGDAYEDNQFLVINSAVDSSRADPLFEARPAPGKTVTKSLGRGLSAQVPLALYSRDDQTLRPDGAPSPTRLVSALNSIEMDQLSAQSEALRLADVVIAWNVFQHFYPYFEVVDTDWDRVLTQSLRRAKTDTSSRQLLRTLRQIIVPLADGHGRVSHPVDSLTTGLPLRFDQVEEEVVVVDTASFGETQSCAQPGDVLTDLNGTPAGEALQQQKQLISGSPQWRTYRALRAFDEGVPGSTALLTLRRPDEEVECQIPHGDRTEQRRWQRQLQAEPRPDSIDVLPGGVLYVDLTRVDEVQPHLDSLAQAESVIFDVRGYPGGGARRLLPHLSADTLRSAHFEVPKIIYPDRQDVVGYTGSRWTLPPKEPQLTGKIAFLTDARAISYAESIMGIVDHYDLGTIVGDPTAGANGNVNPFMLPGGYNVRWTGMRVRKHDGSQHHLFGIEPDVQADRTIEGVRNGDDEVLQRALQVLNGSP